MTGEIFNAEDVRTFYRFLGHSPDEFTEVRIIDPTRKTKTLQEFIRSEDEFVESIERWSGTRQCYAGLNPRKRKKGKTEDVARVTAILLDVDAKHPKDEPASDVEMTVAKKRLDKLLTWIKEQGYEPPFVVMSGNGYHIIQRVDIEIDDRTQGQLEAYHHKAADDLDSMFDLPRIVKISGTLSIKGVASEGRPHRLSFIVDEGSMIIDKKLSDHISSIVVESPAESTDSEPSVELKEDSENRLKTLRKDNPKLDLLLSVECPSMYQSTSEADMATLSILRLSGFSKTDSVAVLREFRGRDKLNREDYIEKMIKKIYGGRGEVRKYTHEKKIHVQGTHVGEIQGMEKPTTIPLQYISPEQLDSTLSKTIVEDTVSKKVAFLIGLLNYTECDQMNLGFNAPSSTGKTYVALEVMRFFPKNDVEVLGYVSPKAFYHEHGQLLRESGSPLMARDEFVDLRMEKWELSNPRVPPIFEWRKSYAKERRSVKNEWNKIPKKLVVDLHQIIIVFLDQPHDKLLREIRPLLSHDRKEITLKITDKATSGMLATKTVTIIGYPTVLFLSTRFSIDEQERTRLLMLSADMSQTKIKKSIEMLGRKLSNRDMFSQNIVHDEERLALEERVQVIKASKIREVIIFEEDQKNIVKRFLDEHPTLIPRLQRDFPRLMALIKAFALLNLQDRKKDENGRLFADETDVENGMSLYNELAPSNELGMPPDLYNFWDKKIEPVLRVKGLHRKEISQFYHDHFKVRIGEWRRNKIIDLWQDIGLIFEDTDPDDARRKLIFSTDYSDGQDKSEQRRLEGLNGEDLPEPEPEVKKKKSKKKRIDPQKLKLLKQLAKRWKRTKTLHRNGIKIENEKDRSLMLKALDAKYVEEKGLGWWFLTQEAKDEMEESGEVIHLAEIKDKKKIKFPRLKRDRAKTVLRLFDSEETISNSDIQKKLADIYGSGFENKIAEAIMGLMEEGALMEKKPGFYRRID